MYPIPFNRAAVTGQEAEYVTRAIAQGEPILKYGKVIGQATQPIRVGQHVHIHNVEALRARDDNERQRLLEVAEFYRSLARVVPGLPHGFKLNGTGPTNSRLARWEARAEECRVLAEHFNDPHCRQQLARLAETYDGLALKTADS